MLIYSLITFVTTSYYVIYRHLLNSDEEIIVSLASSVLVGDALYTRSHYFSRVHKGCVVLFLREYVSQEQVFLAKGSYKLFSRYVRLAPLALLRPFDTYTHDFPNKIKAEITTTNARNKRKWKSCK